MNQEEKVAAEAAVEAARMLGGVVHGLSAALLWGWSVKHVPPLPQVTVARGRRISKRKRHGVALRRLDLPPGHIEGHVTCRLRTVEDCLRRLPFDEALCVADSALRSGVGAEELESMALRALGPGSIRVRRVVACADGRAANAFESCLRAIALQVDGLEVTPQVPIRDPDFLGRPDLVDERLRIVIEADSFEWHGQRSALEADAQRYNRFLVNGWLVLRFSWEDVMLHPEVVREVLEAAVAERLPKVA